MLLPFWGRRTMDRVNFQVEQSRRRYHIFINSLLRTYCCTKIFLDARNYKNLIKRSDRSLKKKKKKRHDDRIHRPTRLEIEDSQSLSVRSGSSTATTALPAGSAAARKLPGQQPKLSSSSPTKNGIGASSPRAGLGSAACRPCCSGCAWMPLGQSQAVQRQGRHVDVVAVGRARSGARPAPAS
jgi:hypothetical protein